MRHERIVISLDFDETQTETPFELYAHLQEWLTITKRNGKLAGFNLSLKLPTFDTESQNCPHCYKKIGSSKAISEHRRIERH